MKYSANFERDWRFLLNNMRKFKFSGVEILRFPNQPSGVDGKRAFHIFDSQGKIVTTRHPLLVAWIINCKRSVNFHLKMWAEGYTDCLINRTEYLNEFSGDVPPWIEKAFMGQIVKALNRSKGSQSIKESVVV